MADLTPKQQKFVQGIIAGQTGVASALQAYDTDKYDTAHAIAVENLQKPSIKEALEGHLAKHQITIDRALKPISKALDATKVNEFTGEVTDDLQTQLKASDRALRLLGISGTDSPSTVFLQQINNYREKYQ